MGIEYQDNKVIQRSLGTSNCEDVGMLKGCTSQLSNIDSETCTNHVVCSEGDVQGEADDKDANASTFRKNCLDSKKKGRTSTGPDVEQLNSASSSSDFIEELDHIVLKERLRMLLMSRKMQQPAMPSKEGSAVVANPLNVVEVKAEPLENVETNKLDRVSLDMFLVKTEPEIPNGLQGDNLDLDHMQLQDRMKLQAANDNAKSESSGYQPFPEDLPQVKISRTRKRKKTATDSVETALEEDAPGLLQILVEQGVTMDEIELYGVADGDDEPINESFIEDGFQDLEAVMSKLFTQRSSLLKLAPVRNSNLSKPNYCLACLFSLVEQARYVRFRGWPAQWGWCRDLQSFIFVFERHNRIVLERPEYGYATYFFELVDSSPVKWQIKRLVLAMKLTGCGRITLLENKPLKVGEELSEGEAKVLMQYGWTPNTGVATMLNYCDRVVHDRKSEKESLDWKSKIGKLLMDGYNGGTVVTVAELATECSSINGEFAEVKMELEY